MLNHPFLDPKMETPPVPGTVFRSGTSKKWFGFLKKIGLVVLLGVLIFGGWYWFASKDKSGVVENTDTRRVEIESGVLPEGFPEDFPYGKEGKVIYNYTVEGVSGSKQSVRKWEVSGSLTKAVASVEEFLADSGWQVLTRAEKDGWYLFGAGRGEESISVILSNGLEKQTFVVELVIAFKNPNVR